MTKFKLEANKRVYSFEVQTVIDLRITTKPHAHLQAFSKAPAKFQNDPAKIVGGVAFTRVDI